jgi:hypothetical protein
LLGIAATGLGRATPKTLAIFVWLYCIAWWFVQDVAKVLIYKILEKYNIFGINNTLMIPTAKDDEEIRKQLIDEERGSVERKVSVTNFLERRRSENENNNLKEKLLSHVHNHEEKVYSSLYIYKNNYLLRNLHIFILQPFSLFSIFYHRFSCRIAIKLLHDTF